MILRRNDQAVERNPPNDRSLVRFSSVQREWIGETCCVIGGGASLTQSDVDLTRGRCRVIAVNNQYVKAPWADVCYFADSRWWTWHKDRPAFRSFAGQKCSIETLWANFEDDIHYLRNYGHLGFSTNADGVKTGQHSGFQSINIAVLAGATRILLLGFDMRPGYWDGGHPVKTPDAIWTALIQSYQSIENHLNELGVEVVNCTPGSALTRFRMARIESVLPHSATALV